MIFIFICLSIVFSLASTRVEKLGDNFLSAFLKYEKEVGDSFIVFPFAC